MASPVVIVDYDLSWPQVFLNLRERLARALGDVAVGIIHFGSTAVPGLAAKPIIDIHIVIASEAELASAIERLARAGYEFEGDLGVAGRYAFRPPPRLPAHHPYVSAKGNLALERHIAFRDYLRANPAAAKAYAALKFESARRYRDNRVAYTNSKKAFVEQALGIAQGFH